MTTLPVENSAERISQYLYLGFDLRQEYTAEKATTHLRFNLTYI
jgi:hypothetical protein